ncbi:MAG: hypothetical protein A3G59_00655 [Candidatus Taylorbacteria bacterium RIFCSPLOWO2_12_FULL_47_20]|uniref:DNA-directed DNA polymerase n=2 Tax=Candidatus Tayloriibacteriota TaxID=1817919 RepID=A0A1G2P957_9BACT|nr:MAG: hypothetical protein A3H68_01240 [Candidatus Taylorbacteria bacterium RIFCSPLOWO2_02_FULL_46_40]OHA44152.1 MAG: hypothetical protein A3G59_00655 [Candidatus Taylorbacteria bacterium RIFCSPLOWO2_12_FULL_47_20]
MEKSKKRLVLFDAHAILHRGYHAIPDFSTSKGEPTGALYGLSSILMKILTELRPDYVAAAYDLPQKTYRHDAYEAYKAGRREAEPELVSQMKRSREIFNCFNIPIYDKPGFEADDILGAIVEQTKDDKDLEIIIASGDLDTLQLVEGERIKVFTMRKGITDTALYNEEEVKKRFGFEPRLLPDYKGLRGDPSDNIPGIKGIGEKTASILVSRFGALEEIYAKLKKDDTKEFTEAGIKERVIKLLLDNEEEAAFSKMLATIHRDVPIRFSLPVTTWSETFELQKGLNLFRELEFRSLVERLKTLKSENGDNPDNAEGEEGRSSGEMDALNIPEDKRRELGVMVSLIDSSITDPPLDEILRFTGRGLPMEAEKKLRGELARCGLEKVYEEIEKPLLYVVRKMEARGVMVDKKYLGLLSKDFHARLEEIEGKIYELAGEKFNIQSPKQLAPILFEKLGLRASRQKKTPGGALSTKESELIKLRDEHPIIPFILEHRELSKLVGTYIDALPALADSQGRIHARFVQIGTTTGRMASKEPNLQNIPNNGELGKKVRKAFVAQKGYKLVSFDYSQIEIRIAAFLSGDEKLIEIFKNGEDVHTAVAAEVFSVPLSEVTKEMRRKAKVINFGVMYGMGVNALRENLGGDRAEAAKFYTDYFQKFSGLAKYLNAVKEETARRGYTQTFFGRRRYFEGIRSPLPFVRAAAERMAINAPIQGTEADIIKIAMARADSWISGNGLSEKVFLILQVHDELVYEIEDGAIERCANEIKKIMEGVLTSKDTDGVPIAADVSAGENWGEMEKIRVAKGKD